jgi:hypothetical protein
LGWSRLATLRNIRPPSSAWRKRPYNWKIMWITVYGMLSFNCFYSFFLCFEYFLNAKMWVFLYRMSVKLVFLSRGVRFLLRKCKLLCFLERNIRFLIFKKDVLIYF